MLGLLIVDDEPTIRRGIRESIDWESRGVRVVGEAGNGRQALELVRALRPDVALVDIVMPRGDGLAFCEACRREFPEVRLIIVSGHDKFPLAQQAIRIGVDDYLLKPVGADQLAAAVDKVGHALMRRDFSGIKDRLMRTMEASRGAALGASRPEVNASARRILARVLDFIESRYLSELELGAAAREAGVSPNHLCKVIRAGFDTTFLELAARYRVEVAKAYLREGKLKLYDVADKAGFSDSHYFARVFKKLTGLTPGEFRDGEGGAVRMPSVAPGPEAPRDDNPGHRLIT
jgi:two-component system, response regulator YesN